MPEGCRPVEWRSCMSVNPHLTGLGSHGPAERRSCMCRSLAWQALGAKSCRVNIVQGCAGLGSMAQQKSCRAVQAWGYGLAEIVNVCGSPALRAHPMEILWFWGVGFWGSIALVGQRSRAKRSEIPWWRVKQQLSGPMGQGLACSACYSFSIWWHEEASHGLGVQSADVSALPDVLSQSSVSLAYYQSPWITEVRRFVSVFQSPSWISTV
jgi:hypothetical protein